MTSRTDTDILGLYQRLQPGMTVEQVAAAADGARLRTSSHPVTSWLIRSASEAAHGTAVLRATFREERLGRLEYELFGDEYQRLAKGSDVGAGMSQEELNRLCRRQW